MSHTKNLDFTVLKNDRVLLKPEFMDDGDDDYIFIAINDMEKGRVSITPINTGLPIPPVYTVNRHWISK